MNRRGRKSALLASAVTALGLTVVAPPAAQAAAASTCQGTLGQVTVSGNLVVPDGTSCTLEGTTVTGDVTVSQDADLFATGARLGDGPDDAVTVGGNGYVELNRSRVAGDVTLRDSYGLYVGSSSLNGSVDSQRAEFIYVYDSTVDGSVQVVRFTSFTAEFTNFDAALSGRDVSYFDVFDSSVDGRVDVADSRNGTYLCTTKVEGSVAYDDNGQVVRLGGSGAAGSGCGSNVIEGSLLATDNTGTLHVVNNLVEGDLTCRYNTGDVYGHDNTVFGDKAGQCEQLQPARQSMAAETRDVENRRETARARAERMAEQRRN